MSAGPNGDLAGKYGPWALILGASEGIGASFARELARRGLPEEIIDATARKVVAVQVQVDLTSDAAVAQVQSKVDRREIGLMIFNAGAVPYLTEFADLAPGRVLECTRLNVMGQTTFAAAFVPLMRACGRGGVILLGSAAYASGLGRLACYAASKAYSRILAEGSW